MVAEKLRELCDRLGVDISGDDWDSPKNPGFLHVITRYLRTLIEGIPPVRDALRDAGMKEYGGARHTAILLKLYEISSLLLIPVRYSSDFLDISNVFTEAFPSNEKYGSVILEATPPNRRSHREEPELYKLVAIGSLLPLGASIVLRVAPAYSRVLELFLPHMEEVNNCLVNALRRRSVDEPACELEVSTAWLNFLENPMQFLKIHGLGTRGPYLVCARSWRGGGSIWSRKQNFEDYANTEHLSQGSLSIGTIYFDTEENALKWLKPPKSMYVNKERNLSGRALATVGISQIATVRGEGHVSANWVLEEEYSSEAERKAANTAIILGLQQLNYVGKDVPNFMTHIGYQKVASALAMKGYHLGGDRLGLYNAMVGQSPPLKELNLPFDHGVMMQELCYPHISATQWMYIDEKYRNIVSQNDGMVVIAKEKEGTKTFALIQLRESDIESPILHCTNFEIPVSYLPLPDNHWCSMPGVIQ